MNLEDLLKIKPESDKRPYTDKGILEDGEGFYDEDEEDEDD